MNTRPALAVLAISVQATTSALAAADVPACPSSLGGYVATVDGGSVTICPSTTTPPGWQATGCPFTTGMVRVDVSTGATAKFLGPCVADPAGADAGGDAGPPCFLDPCVPAGTYEYGYQLPAFAACTNNACAGPTSGEWATVVTVSSTACPADAGPPGSFGASLALWRDVDAAVVDGAVVWSGTCTGPLPGPDGGYCAWEWLDGSAQWAPCPPDGGTLCVGTLLDGGAEPVTCPPPATAGGGSGPTNGNAGSPPEGMNDAGATVPPPEMAAVPEGGGHGVGATTGGGGGGGGCSVSPKRAPGSAFSVGLLLGVIALRGRRRPQ